MSLIINHNLMADNALRNLGVNYKKLNTSVQRLSSGLRINSAADDAAGLAIREMMRADITTMQQGIRNAADAISLIQTAEGAMGVIDEKLIRMKELAEQAATGTYTTAQREIINSEYQAMAAEIDRIANATNFNGVKLLDGSLANQNGGQGLKIHFGVGNDAAEDYYFIKTADVRATAATGLRVGGDGANDIWGQGVAAQGYGGVTGCCAGGFGSLDGPAFAGQSGYSFSYGYNWDWLEDDDAALLSGKYLAGRYQVSSGESLQDLVQKVNLGSQSRVGVNFSQSGRNVIASGGNMAVCLGDEAYYWGSSGAAVGGSALVAQYEYEHSALNAGLFGNANGAFANTATLATALGLKNDPLTATVKGTPNADKAASALNKQIDDLTLNGKLLTSATASAASAMNTGGLYNEALGFMDLTTANKTLAPNVIDPKMYSGNSQLDISNDDLWAVDSAELDLTAAGIASANGLATSSVGRLLGGTAISGTQDVNIWVMDGGGFTTSAQLGQALEAIGDVGRGYEQLSVTLNGTEAGDNQKVIEKIRAALFAKIGAKGGAVDEVNHISDITANGAAVTVGTIWTSASTTTPAKTGMWSLNDGVGNALNMESDDIDIAADASIRTFRSAINTAITAAATNITTPTTQVLESRAKGQLNTGPNYNSTHATKYWVGGAGGAYWTTDAAVGQALGFTNVTLDIDANPDIQDIMTQLSTKLGAAKGTTGQRVDAAALPAGTLTKATAATLAGTEELTGYVTEHFEGYIDENKQINLVGAGTAGDYNAEALASAINHNGNSQFWAMLSDDGRTAYVFNKTGGSEFNSLLACEVSDSDDISRSALNFMKFENLETGRLNASGAAFSLGGEKWAALTPIQAKSNHGYDVWNLTLSGRDVGDQRDIQIAAAGELKLPGLFAGETEDKIINGLDRYSFAEVQNAADAPWAGAEIRTQESAQKALEALDLAIQEKDQVRATLGAYQNRLENTISNLEIQAENLQASESRISDVDVAKEMTEFTRNNVLTQAAAGMMAQANSLSQLALTLLG